MKTEGTQLLKIPNNYKERTQFQISMFIFIYLLHFCLQWYTQSCNPLYIIRAIRVLCYIIVASQSLMCCKKVFDSALNCFADNPIVDAHYVLHYNMPANKKLLGLRLHCLSGNYAQVNS